MDKLISMNEKVSLIAGFAKMAMGEDPVHGWPHVLRVAKYCEIIMSSLKKEINKEILALSILLHDIGRFYKAEVHHAITSSKLARVLLKGLGYDEDFIEEVVHAILAHSFSLGIKAKTIEAKILSDADKLDALGAIGIYRTIYESGRTRRGYSETLRHFREKILILIDKLYLPESKKIAEKLNRRVELYVSWLSDELDNLT